MSDYVTVANLALAKVGEPYRIVDPSENSHPARVIAPLWTPVRRAALRKGKFNFSMTRAELAAQAPTDPAYRSPYPFANRFPVPAAPDAILRLVEVIDPPAARERYKYESHAVLADTAGPVFIRFVRDVPAVGDWDDLFVEAFAARLGFEIADTITGDRGRKSDCWADFQKAVKDSAGVDAKEDPPEDPYESTWVTSRYAGGANCIPGRGW